VSGSSTIYQKRNQKMRTQERLQIKTVLLLGLGGLFLSACASAAGGGTDLAAQTVANTPELATTVSTPEPSATSRPAPTATMPPTAVLPTETAQPTATMLPAAEPTAAEVAVVSDVLYATAVDPEAADQSLDIYYAAGTEAQKPVVIWAHGSGLDKTAGRTLGRLLAKNGFVVLSIDWRDDVTVGRMETSMLREAMENGQCALRFAAEKAAQYGGDPQRVIWTGASAGSWLGGMISFGEGDMQAALDAYAAEHDGPGQRVQCTADAGPAQVTGFVPASGSYPGDFYLGNGHIPEWTEVFAPVAGYTAVGHNPDLQVRLIHGKRDLEHNTAFADTQLFAAALEEAGYDVVLLPQPGYHESYQLEIVEQVKALGGLTPAS
jgi:poly(3-hydroxybutyrate) depolymerase